MKMREIKNETGKIVKEYKVKINFTLMNFT